MTIRNKQEALRHLHDLSYEAQEVSRTLPSLRRDFAAALRAYTETLPDGPQKVANERAIAHNDALDRIWDISEEVTLVSGAFGIDQETWETYAKEVGA